MTNFRIFGLQSAAETREMEEAAAEQRFHAGHRCTVECGRQWYQEQKEEEGGETE